MSTYGPLSQGSAAKISLALRHWDIEWVLFDKGTMGVAQTGGAAQGGVGPAGAPPILDTPTSIAKWAMILWSPQCREMGLHHPQC